MLRLAFDFIITWRETRTRPNAYGKSVPTAKRYLNSLVRLDLIEFRGAQKNGGYYWNSPKR